MKMSDLSGVVGLMKRDMRCLASAMFVVFLKANIKTGNAMVDVE